MFASPAGYLGFSETLHFVESHRDWLMGFVGSDRRHKRYLVRRTPTTLSAIAFAHRKGRLWRGRFGRSEEANAVL